MSLPRTTLIVLLPAFFLVASASELELKPCQEHEDCKDTPHPICGAIALPGFPPKVCMSSALLRAKSGSNDFELIQEQFISNYLTELVALRPFLADSTLEEIAVILTNERTSPDVSFQKVQETLREAYDAIASLDATDRMLLTRYVKRRMATTLERELVIAQDIIEHPDLPHPRGLAALEQQIMAEEKRLEKFGMGEDTIDDMSRQLKVIGRLKLKKAEFEYRTELQQIRASNLTPQERKRAYELAKYGYDLETSITYAFYFQRDASSPSPPNLSASQEPRKITFDLYAIDAPGTGAVADVGGVPPVATANWPPGDTIGKAVLQTTESEHRKAQEGKTWNELYTLEEERDKSTRAQLDRDFEKARRQCQAIGTRRAERRETIMGNFKSRRDALHEEIETKRAQIDKMRLRPLEKKRVRNERIGPLLEKIERLKQENEAELRAFESTWEATDKQCTRMYKAAGEKYRQNVDATANAIKGHRTPDAGEQQARQLPMYDELKNYDESNRGPTFQDPAVQWYMRYIADTLARGLINGLLVFRGVVSAEPPPVSPKVAGHLLKLGKIESDYDKACWAAGLYRLSILAPDVPVGNTGKSLSNLMHDLINFPRPGSQSSTCKYLK